MKNSNHRLILLTLALLASTLACRAATRLILPDPPTPAPSSTPTAIPDTPTPTLPPPTPTAAFEAACPVLLAGIMEEANTPAGHGEEEGTEDENYLVAYTLDGESLGGATFESVPEDLVDEQKDRSTHEAIWNYFAAIIPPDQRGMVREFGIFTDGKNNYLAAVWQTSIHPEHWMLEVDILDSANYYSLTYTLVHEHGHLLTLNTRQVSPSRAIFNNPDDEEVYQREASACPQYFPGEGCSRPGSYIDEFFNRFWQDLYEEWKMIDLIEDDVVYYNRLDDFYETYQDQFLTDYAPTSPAEDIAESWSFFVLSPKPQLDSIANEKILFFYEYPELVQLREEILNRICESFP
jgi:hypothetical protein